MGEVFCCPCAAIFCRHTGVFQEKLMSMGRKRPVQPAFHVMNTGSKDDAPLIKFKGASLLRLELVDGLETPDLLI